MTRSKRMRLAGKEMFMGERDIVCGNLIREEPSRRT
jgi:hypothetical protein